MADVEERVDHLEEALRAFVRDVGIEFNKVYNAQVRGEMETQALREEMKAFKNEMAEFKDEMADFKEEARAQNRQMNRRWAEITHKMGTFAEDMVAPNLPRVAKELFGCETVDVFTVRMHKRWNGETREYDALVACGDYVLVNETKSTLKSLHVDEMLRILRKFREIFPEYREKKLIGGPGEPLRERQRDAPGERQRGTGDGHGRGHHAGPQQGDGPPILKTIRYLPGRQRRDGDDPRRPANAPHTGGTTGRIEPSKYRCQHDTQHSKSGIDLGVPLLFENARGRKVAKRQGGVIRWRLSMNVRA
jgi:hypothetical protein